MNAVGELLKAFDAPWSRCVLARPKGAPPVERCLAREADSVGTKITSLVRQIGALEAEIRLVHLRAHIEMRRVLPQTRSRNTTKSAAMPALNDRPASQAR
jgi:hypothetical protein